MASLLVSHRLDEYKQLIKDDLKTSFAYTYLADKFSLRNFAKCIEEQRAFVIREVFVDDKLNKALLEEVLECWHKQHESEHILPKDVSPNNIRLNNFLMIFYNKNRHILPGMTRVDSDNAYIKLYLMQLIYPINFPIKGMNFVCSWSKVIELHTLCVSKLNWLKSDEESINWAIQYIAKKENEAPILDPTKRSVKEIYPHVPTNLCEKELYVWCYLEALAIIKNIDAFENTIRKMKASYASRKHRKSKNDKVARQFYIEKSTASKLKNMAKSCGLSQEEFIEHLILQASANPKK
ncbi:hypothetical protein CWB89_05555 [Pseudoalteromonas piscicida]|uniref:Uncharacterized protein n=1 Tax=Pseudoalteromonas piscicida TaxID=43662 RepID=A0AAQ2ITA5_PSEO7|nr:MULTISPECIES: hypothetical protein [Pseudoalteromonas]KJY90508.1 hypothetical protein TW75_07705 [Pseudoalteromonas piscicida]TMN40171.1 hypothetical protein CWB95_11295 [Pseudoalteromonas piscicida]TMN44205.1 hypothetical protein CWB94_02320 [Pseudoalteromonas piscicida]TMN50188.1 hypothetical protein CWB92_13820 [Pseudoalteromonas piscicida]TMN57577.1 hypothetical protein CWB91_04280 [Pseudoalteromonas piscicida]